MPNTPWPSTTARLRQRMLSDTINAGYAGLSYSAACLPLAWPALHGVERIRGVPYLDDGSPSHTLDIYRPRDAKGSLPVVLYIHGGGFQSLSKNSHWLMALAYARRGYLVFNINYRLAPAHPFPAAVQDAASAYLWVLAHAEEWGGDLQRMAFAGESAGANLSTSLALATCYKRDEPWLQEVWSAGVVPKVVQPACGIFQVSDSSHLARGQRFEAILTEVFVGIESAYLPHRPTLAPGELELADPVVLLESGRRPDRPLPAFFIPVGTADPLQPETERLHQALVRLGVTSQAAYYPGQPHAFHAFLWRSIARRCWKEMLGFLEDHIKG